MNLGYFLPYLMGFLEKSPNCQPKFEQWMGIEGGGAVGVS